MSAAFTTTRQDPRGVFTDFAPPNLLASTLSIPVGTLVKQVDHQVNGLRARPIASDFAPPNLLLGTFVKPPAPFNPTLGSDNAGHLKFRWSATDFSPPILVGRFLGPAPGRPVDTMGDAWSAGKASRKGIYTDFIPPNILLISPPPKVGPYVPVEIGVEIVKKAVQSDFSAPNTLTALAAVGHTKPFFQSYFEGFIPKPWATTDFAPPNFQTSIVTPVAPFKPQEPDLSIKATGPTTDQQPPNLLASTFGLFLGNPPKVSADPAGYPIRSQGIFDDSPPQNFLTSVSALVISPPLLPQDLMGQAWGPATTGSDFIAPNLITGTLIAAAPPQPPTPVTLPNPGLQALPYTFPDVASGWRRISEVVNQLIGGKSGAVGNYEPPFQSGPLQYAGPSNQLTGSNNFIVGLAIPNPSGVPGPAMLLGSGGGAGANVSFWILQDQAFDTLSPGNDLGITAGETQPGSSARGGTLLLVAGASDKGPGGLLQLQGGTSLDGAGGLAVLQGGNATAQIGIPGDVFIIAGEVGSQGANVHLVATILNGIAGVIRHRGNSTIRWDEFVGDGSWFFYDGSGFGDAGAPVVSKGKGQPVGFATDGYNGPIAYTKAGGGTGTITVVEGRITGVT